MDIEAGNWGCRGGFVVFLKVSKLGVKLPAFNICQNFHTAMSEPLLSPTDFSFEIYKVKEVVRFSEIISTKLLWNQLSTLQM